MTHLEFRHEDMKDNQTLMRLGHTNLTAALVLLFIVRFYLAFNFFFNPSLVYNGMLATRYVLDTRRQKHTIRLYRAHV